MKWQRLAEEQRRACRAPSELEELGLLNLTLHGRWEREAVFVLITAFVDESGTGREPKVFLGALAAPAHRWFAFNRHWDRLLRAERIEYSHIVDMENGRHPFEGWGMARTRPFVRRAARRMNRNCDFGFTAVLAKSDYQEYYLAKLSSKAAKDSPYGLCARAIIEQVTTEAVTVYGANTVVNFVVEDSQHFAGVKRVFDELKEYVGAVAPHLGTITPGKKKEFGGLQGADLVASLGRRSEPTAQFISSVEAGSSQTPRDHGRFPLFHAPLNAESLPSFCVQAETIALERRGRRRSRALANRRARQNG
jgi:hypothetical protein